MSFGSIRVGRSGDYLLTDNSLGAHAEIVQLMPGQLTAFGWLRTANPQTLFDSSAQYGDTTIYWETATSGTNSAVANVLADSAVRLTTGAGKDSFARRQTRAFWGYQPGKGQLVLATFLFGVAVANLTRRIGYFSTTHGVYLEQTGDGLAFVIRKGSSESERVAQSSWNIDVLDGTGRSGIALDAANVQHLATERAGLVTVHLRDGAPQFCPNHHDRQL